MAEIVATFNTVDKTLSVTIDGKAIDNVMEAHFCSKYGYYDGYDGDDSDDYCARVSTMEKDDEEGTRKSFMVTADELRPEDPQQIRSQIHKYFGVQ